MIKKLVICVIILIHIDYVLASNKNKIEGVYTYFYVPKKKDYESGGTYHDVKDAKYSLSISKDNKHFNLIMRLDVTKDKKYTQWYIHLNLIMVPHKKTFQLINSKTQELIGFVKGNKFYYITNGYKNKLILNKIKTD